MQKTVVLVLLCLVISQILAQCQKRPLENGAKCSSGSECLSTICRSGACAAIKLVEAGQSCDSDYTTFSFGWLLGSNKENTCAAGFACNGAIPLLKSGACAKMPKIGETCSDVQCIGSFCAGNSTNKVCTPYRAGAKDAACSSNSDCQTNLKCSSNKCVDAGKEGDTCDNRLACQTGMTCTSAKKCAKFVAVGGTCDDSTLICEDNNFCDSTKKCAAYYSKSEGNVCSVSIDSAVQCSAGLWCKGGQCLKPGPNCTTDGCSGYGQICECPSQLSGAGSCAGSNFIASTYFNAALEVAYGNRNALWGYCQLLKTRPAGFIDPVIVNLVCTAGANAIQVSFLLLAAIFTLLFGLLY